MKPSILKQSVGIDVDSKELVLCIKNLLDSRTIKIKGSRKFKNTLAGFEQLKNWLIQKRTNELQLSVVMETTGVYHENLAYYLSDISWIDLHLILPNVSSHYIKSLNNTSKTDEIDARGLAQMGIERILPVWKGADMEMRNLKKLSRERMRIIDERTIVKNQSHAEENSFKSCKAILRRNKARINFINKQLKQVEKEMTKFVASKPELEQKVNNIALCKGVSFISIIGVIAETNGFALIENRNQLVSYAGYDVVKRESGTSIRGKTKISKKGNSYIRRILYMPALSACRFNEHHKSQYERIRNKTAIKMKGNVAIQRKLLLLIYALYKSGQAYDPLHHKRMANTINKNRTPINIEHKTEVGLNKNRPKLESLA